MFGTPLPDTQENAWRRQLDRFVKAHQQEIAALVWGLYQEWGDRQDTLGIDLYPEPHFVCCSREAIEKLNENVNNQLQEVLGVLDGYSPDKEVVILGIGKGQVKLIQFTANPTPPECFTIVGETVDNLLDRLESRLVEQLK
jgi:hypothetical protein